MSMEMKLNDICNIEMIVKGLEADGVVIFRGFLSEKLDAVIHDYLKVFLDKNILFPDSLHAAKVNEEYLINAGLTNMHRVFFNKEFINISKRYLESKDIDFCHDIYVMKDQVGTRTHAHDLHFDVIPQLKFYFYLNDVTKENGAFEYVPGSHKWTKKIRSSWPEKINFQDRAFTRRLPDKFGPSIPLEAKAGTLVIFDTDTFHKAGTVSQGERFVARGHTKIAKLSEKKPRGLLSRFNSLILKKIF